jgi:hypothetical protein
MVKTYKKYVIGKIQRDRNGKESFMYFEQPIEESEYGMLNNVDMSTLFVIRDLIVMYLSDVEGSYTLDPVLKTFVFSEKEL